MKIKREKYTGIDITKFFCSIIILFYHFFSEHGHVPSIIDDMLSLYAICAQSTLCKTDAIKEELVLSLSERNKWSFNFRLTNKKIQSCKNLLYRLPEAVINRKCR